METEQGTGQRQDRRVRRSRSALMRAVYVLVSERGTAAIPVSDIAVAADVSRPVMYQHFGDLDTLLLETARDLAARELLPRMTGTGEPEPRRDRALAIAQHFANHRAFYRAVLTSSCGFALNKSLTRLLIPVNRQLVQQMSGEAADPQRVEDLATFLTGGGAALVNTWVVDGSDPLDPGGFADRLMAMVAVLTAALRPPTTKTLSEGPDL